MLNMLAEVSIGTGIGVAGAVLGMGAIVMGREGHREHRRQRGGSHRPAAGGQGQHRDEHDHRGGVDRRFHVLRDHHGVYGLGLPEISGFVGPGRQLGTCFTPGVSLLALGAANCVSVWTRIGSRL